MKRLPLLIYTCVLACSGSRLRTWTDGPSHDTVNPAVSIDATPADTTVIATLDAPDAIGAIDAGTAVDTSHDESAIALVDAKRRGASEAVLADTQGRLSECTGSNVFVVVDGVALTPSLDTGCLAGVTRELVLEWGGEVVQLRESHLPYDVLETADEVFITSSTRDVHPVTRIDARELAPGPVTRALADLFATRSRDQVDP